MVVELEGRQGDMWPCIQGRFVRVVMETNGNLST